MKDKIRAHVDELFAGAPKTRRALELKDELFVNLCERYDDLVSQGEDPAAAYSRTINGIGDFDELVELLKEQSVFTPESEQQQRKKSALLISIAVALYIISLVPLIAYSYFNLVAIGLVFTLVICAVATMLLVYNTLSKPKYEKIDDSIVEEFKEWKLSKAKKKAMMGSVQSLVWICAVIVYLLISFTFRIWYISWIVFLIAAAISQFVRLAFLYNESNESEDEYK